MTETSLAPAPGAASEAARAQAPARGVVLARSADDPAAPPPAITVLLAAHDRMDVLPDCLAAFAAQQVAGGLELIVIDDGSTDGTAEYLAGARFDVPFVFLRQENAGAAAARNTGLPYARGPLVLFVNDDTIPFEGLVQGHLDAHAALDDPKAIVLGTFEQPEEECGNAFVRLLERNDFVFGYADMDPDADLGGEHFYTCNVSVRTAAVRALGGFDEDFPWYTEDTELGVRLEAAGHRIVYRPDLRALHRHVPTYDGIARRQRAVARAHVHLYAKHPRKLEGADELEKYTRAGLSRVLAENADLRRKVTDAVRGLAEVDLCALERLGGDFAATAARLEGVLKTTFPALNSLWWREGFLEGLERMGAGGFDELLARAPLALEGPRAGASATLVVVPPGGEAGCRLLVETFLARFGDGGARALLLWPESDEPAAVGALERALAPVLARARRAHGDGGAQVLLLDEDPPLAGLALRWLAGVDALVLCGSGRDAALCDLAELAGTPVEDPETWLDEPARSPWPIAEPAAFRLLAAPAWGDAAALDALVRTWGPLLDDARVALHLLLDPAQDGEPAQAAAPLEEAFVRAHGPTAGLSIVLETSAGAAAERARLARATDALLVAGAAPPDEPAFAALPRLATTEDVAAWRAGLDEAERAPLPRARRAPEPTPEHGSEEVSRA